MELEPRAFRIDGLAPSRVVAPTTEEDVAGALAEARDAGKAVVPVGGGTLLSVGNPPQRYDVALSTLGLAGLVEYSPADLTVVARAGTTFSHLDRELAAHGQFLPLDPPVPQQATLGGVLATNTSGPWRAAFGSARDMVIGMRIALPNGQVARSGGRVVKNVAGYDLAKLFIGSFGSLGVVVEVAFKVYPRPPVVRTLVLRRAQIAEALQLAGSLRHLGPGLLMVAVVNEPLGRTIGLDGAGVVVTVGGTARAATELADTVQGTDRSAGRLIGEEEGTRLVSAIRDFPARATAKISTLPTAVGQALEIDGIQEALSYPSVGLTYLRLLRPSPAVVQAHRERLSRAGGSLALWQAETELKRASDAWGRPGPEIALMRKVKDVFDREAVLSPGRFVGGL